MKTFSLFVFFWGFATVLFAQTNTFPSTGSVGIGTLTPSYKLDVMGPIRGYAEFSSYTPDGLFSQYAIPSGINTPNGAMRIRFGYMDQGGGQYWGRIGFLGNTNWSLGTAHGGHNFSIGRHYGGSDLQISNTGNITIGTEPVPWGVFSNMLDLKSGSIGGTSPTDFRFFSNLYYDGGAYRLRANGAASLQIMNDGEFNWYTSSSFGNAGDAVALSRRMYLDGTGLSVNGNIKTKKIIVSQTGWPDYVFDSSYALRSLSEVEKFIAKNKHLPDMPSAKEVEEKGISVGENQALLLKKIEELTLHLIRQDKLLEKQAKQISDLQKKLYKK
jgi:hypothetical protein